jgi:hypothetical protein
MTRVQNILPLMERVTSEETSQKIVRWVCRLDRCLLLGQSNGQTHTGNWTVDQILIFSYENGCYEGRLNKKKGTVSALW